MTLPDLENLVRAGKLKNEPPNQDEFDGLVKLGEAKFKDAQVAALSLESRFELAYGASHAFALAAFAGTATDRTFGTSYSSVWNTRWVCRGISGVCLTRLTGRVMRRITVATSRSTSACYRICWLRPRSCDNEC